MRRVSIRTLMVGVIIVATVLVALKNANDRWVEGLLLTPFAVVGATVLGVFLQRGRERAWCAGFALAGGSYLALAFAPWLGSTVRPELGTTHLLNYVHDQCFGPNRVPEINAALQAVVSGSLTVLDSATGSADPAPPRIRPRSIMRSIANYDHFQRVGHSLFALFTGLYGAMVAAWFYRRREKAAAAVGSARAGDPPSEPMSQNRTSSSFPVARTSV
jgi:hypothetical protein